jgi:hypothetical protein
MLKAESAANPAVTLTISAVTDKRTIAESLVASYDSTTPTGSLQVKDVAVVKGEIDIYVAAFLWPFGPLYSSPGADMAFTLGAGGAGVVGKMACEVG